MDWWLIPIAVGVVVLLWVVWVAAFHPAETVSVAPELDAYVPGRSDPSEPSGHTAEADLPVADPPEKAGSPTGPRPVSDPVAGATDPGDDPHEAPDTKPAVADEDGGIWIELDITPLFPSSEHRSMVGLTQAEDPEVAP